MVRAQRARATERSVASLKGRARTLLTVGAEVTMTDHFRYEVCVARQADRLPDEKDLDALGIVLKWYR